MESRLDDSWLKIDRLDYYGNRDIIANGRKEGRTEGRKKGREKEREEKRKKFA